MAITSILQCFLVDEEIAHDLGNHSGKHRPAILEPFFAGIREAAPDGGNAVAPAPQPNATPEKKPS